MCALHFSLNFEKNYYYFIDQHKKFHLKTTQGFLFRKCHIPTVQRIRKVMTEFEDGTRVSFGRKDGRGRPKSDVRIENVAKVKNIN